MDAVALGHLETRLDEVRLDGVLMVEAAADRVAALLTKPGRCFSNESTSLDEEQGVSPCRAAALRLVPDCVVMVVHADASSNTTAALQVVGGGGRVGRPRPAVCPREQTQNHLSGYPRP